MHEPEEARGQTGQATWTNALQGLTRVPSEMQRILCLETGTSKVFLPARPSSPCLHVPQRSFREVLGQGQSLRVLTSTTIIHFLSYLLKSLLTKLAILSYNPV